ARRADRCHGAAQSCPVSGRRPGAATPNSLEEPGRHSPCCLRPVMRIPILCLCVSVPLAASTARADVAAKSRATTVQSAELSAEHMRKLKAPDKKGGFPAKENEDVEDKSVRTVHKKKTVAKLTTGGASEIRSLTKVTPGPSVGPFDTLTGSNDPSIAV